MDSRAEQPIPQKSLKDSFHQKKEQLKQKVRRIASVSGMSTETKLPEPFVELQKRVADAEAACGGFL